MSFGQKHLSAVIEDAWIDYNDHMSDYAYGILFSRACEISLRELDLGADYLARSQCSLYAVDNRLLFLKETKRSERVTVEYQLLSAGDVSLSLLFVMKNTKDDVLALAKSILLHVCKKPGELPRSIKFVEALKNRLENTMKQQCSVSVPEKVSRHIARLTGEAAEQKP